MKRLATTACLAAATFVGVSALAGCNREISHTRETKVSPSGTVKQKETTVKEAPDGTVIREENRKTTTVDR